MAALDCAWVITERMCGLKRSTAAASSSVTRGLLRARSASSSLRTMPWRLMVKASAPRSERTALDTVAFMPWMSETTVMIDDTATMLPSSVNSERSLFAQIELSASFTDSKILAHRAATAVAPDRSPTPGRRPPCCAPSRTGR